MEKNVGLALVLTTLAGLSTTLGSLLGLAVRRPGPRFMSATLGFSAGVMVMVSFVELLPTSIGSIGFGWVMPAKKLSCDPSLKRTISFCGWVSWVPLG